MHSIPRLSHLGVFGRALNAWFVTTLMVLPTPLQFAPDLLDLLHQSPLLLLLAFEIERRVVLVGAAPRFREPIGDFPRLFLPLDVSVGIAEGRGHRVVAVLLLATRHRRVRPLPALVAASHDQAHVSCVPLRLVHGHGVAVVERLILARVDSFQAVVLGTYKQLVPIRHDVHHSDAHAVHEAALVIVLKADGQVAGTELTLRLDDSVAKVERRSAQLPALGGELVRSLVQLGHVGATVSDHENVHGRVR